MALPNIRQDYLRTQVMDLMLNGKGVRTLMAGPACAILKNILMVGAVTEKSESSLIEEDLAQDDVMNLWGALRSLQDQGVLIHPEFQVQVVNLEYGDDFLKGDYKADLIVTSWVFDGGYDTKTAIKAARAAGTSDFFYASSSEHSKPSVWHDAALRSGAKVICCVGGSGEVTAKHFLGSRFNKFGEPAHMITMAGRDDFLRELAQHDLSPRMG
jgi:hypothetical protein